MSNRCSDASRRQFRADLWLDARRAAWFPDQRALAIADLHLGYLWAQRCSGHLLPVNIPDDTLSRLSALVDDYRPEEVILLGDIVHRAVDVPAIAEDLRNLLAVLRSVPRVRWVAGNHDRGLEALLQRAGSPERLEAHVRVGPHLLRHGDESALDSALVKCASDGLFVSGHEHPAIWLGDGVAGSVKCPCFLASSQLLILPAFSDWAAGVSVEKGMWMGDLARAQSFTQAIAVVGKGLIPIPLSRSRR